MILFLSLRCFGPVCQGEGEHIGVPTVFVRTGGCDSRCSWCLGPNTQITLSSGKKKKIKDIQIGDWLIGYDEKSGTLQPTQVVNKVSHESDDIWSFKAVQGRKSVVATGDHMWMTKQGWKAMRDIVPGDVILSAQDYAISSWLMRGVDIQGASEYMLRNNPMRDEAVRKKVSKTHRERWTQEMRDAKRVEQQAFEGHRLKMLGDKNPMKNPETVAKQVASRADWKPSSIELRVKRLVEEAGLPYELCLMKIRIGRRYPDFHIPGTNKVVEVYHPSFYRRAEEAYADVVEYDYHRLGYEVLALQVAPGISDEIILRQLTEFMLNGYAIAYCHPLPRKAHGAMKGDWREVYDITCSPYPTFFANAMLSHNCDTLYAVLPEYRAGWKPLHADTVVKMVNVLAGEPVLVTLSGGNPAMQKNMGKVIDGLHFFKHEVTIETQGTVFPKWAEKLDYITVSPKPPSSKMELNYQQLDRWIWGGDHVLPVLKVVVFDDQDYEFARTISQRYSSCKVYLQVGNDLLGSHTYYAQRDHLLERLRWLQQRVLVDRWYGATVLPQLHVLLHGNTRGV